MINKPPSFKGLNIRISRVIPIKGDEVYESGAYTRETFTNLRLDFFSVFSG